MPQEKRCSNCSALIAEGDVFCRECGQKIVQAKVGIKDAYTQPDNIVATTPASEITESLTFGASDPVVAYVEEQPTKQLKPTPLAYVALAMGVLGVLLMTFSNELFTWIAFGFGIADIITAIIALILRRRNSLAIVSIALAIAIILAWSSLLYDWPF